MSSDHEQPTPPDIAFVAEPEPLPDADDAPESISALSPAVRRLVRQYDLDITGIHGSGPAGRIRVGDVIGLLGGRTEPTSRAQADPARTIPAADDPLDAPATETPYRTTAPPPAVDAAASPQTSRIPTSSVFECDLNRVLAHRKQQRRQNVEILLTSYYLVACSEALRLVPELLPANAGRPNARFGVIVSAADGATSTAVVDAEESPVLESLNDRLRALDAALRAGDAAARDLGRTGLLIHHYGMSGSLLTTPTPIGAGHTASLGLGRVRRQVVVRASDGEETPRIAAITYVSLTFHSDRLDLPRANRFLSHFVRVLEHWPE